MQRRAFGPTSFDERRWSRLRVDTRNMTEGRDELSDPEDPGWYPIIKPSDVVVLLWTRLSDSTLPVV